MKPESFTYADFVSLVIEALNFAGVNYLIGGAVAAWAWGEPRATMDLDLVVDLPIESIGYLSKALEERDMLVPEEIILDRLLDDRADIPIHAIHMYSGFKADLYLVRPDDVFRKIAFQRRKLVDLGPDFGEIFLHTPEDLIIYKLIYYSLSEQSKHLRDITAIVLSLGDDLDYEYIEKWAAFQGLAALWGEMIRNIRSSGDQQIS